ncbi:MAG: DUF2793 domain-containing protein [Pseudomonadota bacterium]
MPERILPGSLGLSVFDPGDNGWANARNLAMLKLSVLTLGSVLSRVTPLPGSPTPGQVYIVPSGAGSNANDVAVYDGPSGSEAWVYFVPAAGWELWDAGASERVRFDGSAWAAVSSGGGGSTTLAGLTDVYGTPSDGQVLTYDPDAGGSGVPGWRPETPSTAGGNPGIINVSSSRVLDLADAWDTLVFTAAAALTIPDDATTDFPLGTILSFAAVGGIGTLTAASLVTLNGRPAGTVDSEPPSTGTIPQFTLIKIAANTWVTSLEGVA